MSDRISVTLPRSRWEFALQVIRSIGWNRAYPLAREIEAQIEPDSSRRMSQIGPTALVNGGLYLVRWPANPNVPDTLALFITDRNECDEDEEPRERWAFFGEGMDCYRISEYEAITRLDVVPVDWLNTEAGTWPE